VPDNIQCTALPARVDAREQRIREGEMKRLRLVQGSVRRGANGVVKKNLCDKERRNQEQSNSLLRNYWLSD
jgi:hypothetical protein